MSKRNAAGLCNIDTVEGLKHLDSWKTATKRARLAFIDRIEEDDEVLRGFELVTAWQWWFTGWLSREEAK
jgi:hypothetical protein